MNFSDFTSNAPGELVRIPMVELASETRSLTNDRVLERAPLFAFSPNPLPPALSFDGEMTTLLSRASVTIGRLDEKLLELPNPNIVIRPLQRHEAIESSRIEGTIAEFDELALFEADLSGGGSDDEAVREVVNYVEALQWGLDQMAHRNVTTGFIKELHRYLLDGISTFRYSPGALREVQAIIGSRGQSADDARFIPPPPHELAGLLLDLERFINDQSDIPSLVRAALAHYQFETIHPFPDGNGRVGRMLIPILLKSWGTMSLPHVDFSAYVVRHRATYLDRLLGVSQRGDWRPWIMFFLEAIDRQGATTLRQTRALIELRERYLRTLRDEFRAHEAAALADHLLERGSITTKQVQAISGVSNSTALRLIKGLENAQVVTEASGRQRDRIYIARGVQLIFTSDRD